MWPSLQPYVAQELVLPDDDVELLPKVSLTLSLSLRLCLTLSLSLTLTLTLTKG